MYYERSAQYLGNTIKSKYYSIVIFYKSEENFIYEEQIIKAIKEYSNAIIIKIKWEEFKKYYKDIFLINSSDLLRIGFGKCEKIKIDEYKNLEQTIKENNFMNKNIKCICKKYVGYNNEIIGYKHRAKSHTYIKLISNKIFENDFKNINEKKLTYNSEENKCTGFSRNNQMTLKINEDNNKIINITSKSRDVKNFKEGKQKCILNSNNNKIETSNNYITESEITCKSLLTNKINKKINKKCKYRNIKTFITRQKARSLRNETNISQSEGSNNKHEKVSNNLISSVNKTDDINLCSRKPLREAKIMAIYQLKYSDIFNSKSKPKEARNNQINKR